MSRFYSRDIDLEVPVVRNINGFTALDVIFGRKKFHQRLDPNFFWRAISKEDEDKCSDIPACGSPNTASIIFDQIKGYGFMHSGYQLSWAVV